MGSYQGYSVKNNSDEKLLTGEIWLEKQLAMAGVHIMDCKKGWFAADNPLAVQLATELDKIQELDDMCIRSLE